MAASIEIVLRKDKVNKYNESPLHVRIIKNRRVNYVSTGIKMPLKYWDEEMRKVKRGFPNSQRVNNYLNTLKVKYQDEVLKEETKNTAISSKQIKKRITGNNNSEFFEVANHLIEKYKLSNKTRTRKKADSICEKIRKFTGRQKLLFEDITQDFLHKYEIFLANKMKNKVNTINKDLRFIRRVINEGYRLSLISQDSNPFNNYILKTEKTIKQFLSEKEIEKIENLNLDDAPKQAIHRDMFIFSCYTGGLRVSDTLLLQWKSLEKTHIYLSIKKTDTPLSIKLPDRSIEIIDRYRIKKTNKSFIFPILDEGLDLDKNPEVEQAISNATALINKNLKIIAGKAKIEKNLTFHVARHTWATRALRKGISIDKVSKLMGHSAIKETQIYAKIVNEDLDKAMDVFN